MAGPIKERTAEQMAAPLAEDSVLARLIAVGRDRFADQYWGQQPLLSPAADLPGGFGALLSADAIDELVSRRGLQPHSSALPRMARLFPTRPLRPRAASAPASQIRSATTGLSSSLPTDQRWYCRHCIGCGPRFSNSVSGWRLSSAIRRGERVRHSPAKPRLQCPLRRARRLRTADRRREAVANSSPRLWSRHYVINPGTTGSPRWRGRPRNLRCSKPSSVRATACIAPRISPRGDSSWRCQHPPHTRGSRMDPLRAR